MKQSWWVWGAVTMVTVVYAQVQLSWAIQGLIGESIPAVLGSVAVSFFVMNFVIAGLVEALYVGLSGYHPSKGWYLNGWRQMLRGMRRGR